MKIKDGFSGQRSLVIPKLITDNFKKDLLLDALSVTAIGFYPNALYHFRERVVPIDENILIYCVRGKGFCEVDGKTYDLNERQYLIIPSGRTHSYGSNDKAPWTIYWVHFKGSLASQYIEDEVYPKEIIPSDTSRIDERIEMFEEIFEVIDRNLGIDSLRYASSLLHRFLGSLKFISHYRDKTRDEMPLLENLLHYMKENIEAQISIKDLAGKGNLSEVGLYRLFKERTGYSPMNYFNLLKIRRACELIEYSSMKINQICHKVGIADPYYFSRLFHKIMGVSPRQYRNKIIRKD